MDFLTAVLGYLLLCLIVFILYRLRNFAIFHPVIRYLCGGFTLVRRLIPHALRRCIERAVTWFLFDRHCLYQVLYVTMVLVGHAVLIMDVIAQLYRLSAVENHLFVGLASLFCNGLCYVLVCLTDPGVINSRNILIYGQIYPHDNVFYTPKQCSKCMHSMPARSKHCARCDQCVFRFDHHCVWTNCCIGGQNHAHFLLFLASLLVMILNAIWLSFRVLHHYTVREGLWYAQYIDTNEQLHPMDWSTLIQHLFMTFPRVVTMAAILSCAGLALLIYFVHHIRLVCSNQTAYEYDRLRALVNCRGQPGTILPHYLNKTHCRKSVQPSKSWLYDHGLWANWCEVFGFQTTNSLRELRRRLPAQMEFKTY